MQRQPTPLKHALPTHFFALLYRPVCPDEYLSHFSYSLANGYDVCVFLIFCNILRHRPGNRGSHRVA